jgi:hypothetical protein
MIWTTTKFNLKLSIKIDLEKYNNQTYTLPPKELGLCKNWRFEKIDEKYTLFWAIWDLRQINNEIKLDDITKKLNDIIVLE